MRFLHKCEVCEKEFTRQWNLERHKLIHKDSDMETEGPAEPKSMLQKLVDGEIKVRRGRGYSESTNESDEDQEEEEEEGYEEGEEEDKNNEFWERLADQVIGS